MTEKTLEQIVREQPYADFAEWWPMGESFLAFMSAAILGEWQAATGSTMSLVTPDSYVSQYIEVVYGRSARSSLTLDFAQNRHLATIYSGEFDALSYGFFRAAFEHLATLTGAAPDLALARHRFCQRVGKAFFTRLKRHLQLQLPIAVESAEDFSQLQSAINQIGDFLREQGYLRDHFDFRFDVNVEHAGQAIVQQEADVLPNLRKGETSYALYEMGYPAILPSAVYLYHTMGEAQHHSSRTIEDLFEAVGLTASETDDFDPTGLPSDRVVELWEIRAG